MLVRLFLPSVPEGARADHSPCCHRHGGGLRRGLQPGSASPQRYTEFWWDRPPQSGLVSDQNSVYLARADIPGRERRQNRVLAGPVTPPPCSPPFYVARRRVMARRRRRTDGPRGPWPWAWSGPCSPTLAALPTAPRSSPPPSRGST